MAISRDQVVVEVLTDTKKSIQSLGRYAVAIGGAIAAVAGIKRVVTDLIDAYQDQERAETKLAAALKATSGAIGITQKQFNTMAREMAQMTRFSDEAIADYVSMSKRVASQISMEMGSRLVLPIAQ